MILESGPKFYFSPFTNRRNTFPRRLRRELAGMSQNDVWVRIWLQPSGKSFKDKCFYLPLFEDREVRTQDLSQSTVVTRDRPGLVSRLGTASSKNRKMGGTNMRHSWRFIFISILPLMLTICAAQDLVSIIHGTVKKVDKDTKTVVVKTADGTEHTIKVADRATV